MREFILNDFKLLHKELVSSFVGIECGEMRAWKWWGSFGRTVVRRLLGDPEEMKCVFGEVH